jgi:hypothetical protein
MEFVTENKAIFQGLRAQYPEFRYRKYSWRREDALLVLSFTYELAPGDSITTSIELSLPEGVLDETIRVHEDYIFRIGLAEAISYWKAHCSPVVHIDCGELSPAELSWWSDTWYDGMGEFRYRNGLLDVSKEDWVRFADNDSGTHARSSFSVRSPAPLSGNLIAFTGGKDSTLALAMLNDSALGPNETFFIQTLAPSREKIFDVLGVDYPETVIKRTVHPRLLELNASGALNGHTPFSIIVAFLGVFTASLRGLKYVIVANEQSSNQPTVPGTQINHQYSKSIVFEKRFQEYSKMVWPHGPLYFSLLRPFSEIGVAFMLKQYERAMPYISSCNVKDKTGLWCGKCAKCLFSFLLFSATWDVVFATKMFGVNMLDHAEHLELLNELTGIAATRPFECVGTTQETLAILARIFFASRESRHSPLLKDFWEQHQDMLFTPTFFASLACEFHEHAIPEESFVHLLKHVQDESIYG